MNYEKEGKNIKRNVSSFQIKYSVNKFVIKDLSASGRSMKWSGDEEEKSRDDRRKRRKRNNERKKKREAPKRRRERKEIINVFIW